MLIALKSTSLVLVIISSMCIPISNRFYVTQANSGIITTSLKKYPSLMASLNVKG